MHDEKFLVRNIDANKLFQNFMIAAIASILSIRLFLKLTSYPIIGSSVSATDILVGLGIIILGGLLLLIAIGNYSKEISLIVAGTGLLILLLSAIGLVVSAIHPEGGLHIAHVLIGGLLMALAVIILLSLLGRSAANIAAVTGGIGFGYFIDEIGKLVTRDSNYFFQPSIAIIYAILMAAYIGFRLFEKYSVLSPDEYLINAIEYLKESVNNSLASADKRKALVLLNKCDAKSPVVKNLKKLFRSIDAIQPKKPGPIAKTRKIMENAYIWIVSKKRFTTAVIWFFAAMSLTSLWNSTVEVEGLRAPLAVAIIGIYAAYKLAKGRKTITRPAKAMLIVTAGLAAAMAIILFQGIKLPEIPTMELLELASSGIAGGFVLAGMWQIRKSRLRAYNIFKYSVLISIFLTQFFAFYREQLGAVLGLFGNIAILIVLEYVIDEEEALAKNGNKKRGD